MTSLIFLNQAIQRFAGEGQSLRKTEKHSLRSFLVLWDDIFRLKLWYALHPTIFFGSQSVLKHRKVLLRRLSSWAFTFYLLPVQDLGFFYVKTHSDRTLALPIFQVSLSQENYKSKIFLEADSGVSWKNLKRTIVRKLLAKVSKNEFYCCILTVFSFF